MLTDRRLLVLVPLLVFACENTPEPLTPPQPGPPPASAPSAERAPPPPMFDPLAAGLTPEGQTRLCDDHLAAAQKLVEAIRAGKGASPGELTYETTIGRFDDAIVETHDAAELPHLMALAHPDAAVR